jgi:hypothetical protein
VAIGLLGLYAALAGTAAARLSVWAALLGWIGAGLTLTYYGAEVYGLRVIGRQALAEHDASLLALAGQVRGARGSALRDRDALARRVGGHRGGRQPAPALILAAGLWRTTRLPVAVQAMRPA